MSDNIIVDTATRIFADLCEPQTVNAAEEGHWPAELWNALEESGLTLTWVPENLGGAGAEMLDGFAVLRAAGRFAAPVPLAFTPPLEGRGDLAVAYRLAGKATGNE